MSDESAYVRRLLDETRQEIDRADNKANIVLAAAMIIVAGLTAGLIAGDVSLSGHGAAIWILAFASGATLLGGVACVGAAVYPRLGTPEPDHARYFMEAAQYATDGEAFQSAIKRDAEDSVDRERQQIHVLSRLLQRKYMLTQRGMALLAAGFVIAGVDGLLAKIL